MSDAAAVSLTEAFLRMASEIQDHGVDFVVVGGTARAALVGEHWPADLDIVVADSEPNIARLVTAVRALGVVAGEGECRSGRTPVRFITARGPLDVFLERHLPPPSAYVGSTAIPVSVSDGSDKTLGHRLS